MNFNYIFYTRDNFTKRIGISTKISSFIYIYRTFIKNLLVRMRSAVRIRPAAPRSPVFSRKQDFFFAYFRSMGEGLKQSGRMLLPLREIRLAYRANSACHTVIIFSHSIYSSANSDSTREGLQIYPISICPRSVMGTLTKERRRSSCVR